MVNSWRTLIVSLVLPLMLMFTACSNGGDNGGSPFVPSVIVDVIDDVKDVVDNVDDIVDNIDDNIDDNEVNPPVTRILRKKVSFGLVLKNSDESDLKVFDYKLRIQRNGEDLMQSMSDYITSVRNSNGSINIIFTKDTTTVDGVVEEVKGLSGLQNGDVVTFSAAGFTPQQFSITQEMIDNRSVQLALKAVSSRQTFSLADLLGNAGAVQPRSTFGASVNEVGNDVVITTSDKRASLTFSKENFKRVARQISRLPRASVDTEVYLDMTPVDPVTEHEATIGDFTYDPTVEPRNSRSFRATRATDGSEDYGLESVTMADIQMTTSDGDTIDCFGGGTYDEESATCSDDGEATLQLKVPESQFDDYARKYNAGDRVVPLYSYNESKASWVRQLDADGNGKDGELVLEDNNANQKADSGDTLYIEGKVTHFSWWNGDYPYSRGCVDVFVDETNSTAVSRVHVKGVDYAGREFDSYLEGDEAGEQVNGLSAKANAIVEVSLIMKSGEVGDSVVVTTGDAGAECVDAGTLYAPLLTDTNLTIIVEDTDGNRLENASVNFNYNYQSTDENGQVSYDLAVKERVVGTVNVSYNNDGFYVSDSVELNTTNITNPTKTIVLDIRKQVLTGTVKESVNNQAAKLAEGAYVEIYANDWSYYQYARTDVNGSFSITLPKSKVINSPEARIYIYSYNREYSYYPYKSQDITLNEDSSDLGTYTLAFSALRVSGRVTNNENEGIPSAYVASRNFYRSAYTDTQGYYNMTIISDSDNTSANDTISAYDYKSAKRVSQDTTLVSGSENEVNFEIDQRKATIRGKVVTQRGIALSGIYVYYSKDYSSVLTDVNGSFELKTYYDGNASLYLYDYSSYSYLQVVQADGLTTSNRSPVQNVKLGEVKEMGNLIIESKNFAPIIENVTVNPSAPLAGQDFYIDVKAYDPDGDDVTYTLEQLYSDSPITEVNSSGSFKVNIDKSSYVYFNIIVEDDQINQKSTKRFLSLYVKNHAKPIIEEIKGVDYNWNRSTDMQVSVKAYSPEGNTLTYSFELVNLADSSKTVLSGNENNVTLSAGSIANGRYKLNVVAKDAYGTASSASYFLADNSVAPKIESIEVNGSINQVVNNGDILRLKVNNVISFTSKINDNVDTPTYRWSVLGKNIQEQNVAEQILNSTGFYYVSLTVRDKIGRSANRYFYINVEKNPAPVVNSVTISPFLVTKKSDGTFVYDGNITTTDVTLEVNATDIDDESLYYTFGNIDGAIDGSTGAIGASEVNGSKAKYLLNSNLTAGRHSIKVTIDDNTTQVERYVPFDVLVNQAPVMTLFIVPVNVKVGGSLNLRTSAQDPNGDKLSYSWSASPNDGITFGATNIASPKVTFNNEGNVTLTLVVSDGDANIRRSAVVKVKANQVPIIKVARISAQTIKVGATLDLFVDAADIDGKVSTIEWKLYDVNGTYVDTLSTKASETITLSDTISDGNYTLEVVVTDDNTPAAQTSQSFDLTVVPPNKPPVIESFSASTYSAIVGEEVVLNVVAEDPDGEATIIWPYNAYISVDATNPDKAIFSANEEKSYKVTVRVSDGVTYVEKSITIDVRAINLEITSDTASAVVGSDFKFTAFFSDDTSVPSDIQWSIEAKPEGSTTTLSSNAAVTTLRADEVGTYRVKAKVTLFGVVYEASQSVYASSSITEIPDLEGTLTDSEGNILSGAQLRLYNRDDSAIYDMSTTSDGNGHYVFNGVPAGTYYLVVYAGESAIAQTQVITIGE